MVGVGNVFTEIKKNRNLVVGFVRTFNKQLQQHAPSSSSRLSQFSNAVKGHCCLIAITRAWELGLLDAIPSFAIGTVCDLTIL